MTLAELITRDVDDIVGEWEQFARATVPPAVDLTPEELRDHARLLLLAVANHVAGDRHSGSSGLGLGLYIAREIAVAHGGSLNGISTEEDGTTFTARLHRQTPPDRGNNV
jgi:hypothetical protein